MDARCTRPRPARGRGRRSRSRRNGSRGDLAKAPVEIFLDDQLARDRSVALDEELLRNRHAAPPREDAAASVVDTRVRDVVTLEPPACVGRIVLRVDAEEGDAAAVAAVARLQ